VKSRDNHWIRSALTDHQGEFDTGRILVAVVIVVMLALQGYDVIVNLREFKPNDLGMGVAGVLGGFAAYLWGDTRRPQANTTTIQAMQTTTESTPDKP